MKALIVIKYEGNNLENFKNRVEELKKEFDNILVINNSLDELEIAGCSIYNNLKVIDAIIAYLKNNQNINIVAYLESFVEINNEDILEYINEVNNDEDTIIYGVNESKNVIKRIINRIFNILFNTNFKNIFADIIVFNVSKIRNDNVIVKNDSLLPVLANKKLKLKEEVIEKRRVESNFKMGEYLKFLIPYFIKGILPYLISFVLFLIIFMLRDSSNDLEGILYANCLAEIVGVVVHISLNYKEVYKNNYISNNIIYILKKLFRIILSSFFIYILYNLLNINILISKFIIDLILLIIINLFFQNIGFKK